MQQLAAVLESRGARKIPHPGGDLLAHLTRVAHLLENWGADRDLCVAGLCHACYGTDELDVDLFDSARRDELTRVIGQRAEELVYVYAACDRKHVFSQLGRQDPAEFRDRFTDTTRLIPTADLNRFMELTVANELDLVRHNTEFKEKYGHQLFDLFTRTRELMSAAARREYQELLGT
ncbi:DUF6817 domain-containing protein [Nocardiopsis rhodophaea]|uniref:DUF6817 domain-containing protein n=1 Tax=Nocardiopsis rhodophaea TaxID=280238 RepID=UPI0031D4B35C